ncbi:Lnb N-terminal periplasmic domain-containing protein [Acinetobacter shaoyimingii]|uniref:DUF4105 domain-containing protein n=1 Tax=Acinetobacter shaoyimingii TaxID=2715164 RepID=A0A6G8RSL7_9GAMM|nr:DUF4105 domain-containing protein [Acinetobacter shaoyimingii]QIO04959.1 DUF4105 domain-containing protein [Acinetobacter shaoyimingii]
MNNIGKDELLSSFGMAFLHSTFSLFVLLSSIWLCFAIWVQEPFGWLFTRILIGIWIVFAMSIIGIYATQHFFSRRIDVMLYILIFLFGLFWYFSLTPKQDRDWSPEVAKILSYERNGDHITLHHVRNFNWHQDGQYDEHWETRQYDLNQITRVNIIASYWMGPQIAHTLVSFDFADTQPLTFSIEIRKEKDEKFSAIGGFFRQYEVSLIAADEKDIVYTRSNIRGEQVYFFPVKMPKAEMKALFLEYLNKSDQLQEQAKWYNTLTSNCTTLVFDMVQAVSQKQLPTDYRLLASGYLPNYLYDLGALNHQWNMETWYQRAHVNPRTAEYEKFKYQTSLNYSEVLRYGLSQVQPKLNPSKPNHQKTNH